jgi:hypothetical protein
MREQFKNCYRPKWILRKRKREKEKKKDNSSSEKLSWYGRKAPL